MSRRRRASQPRRPAQKRNAEDQENRQGPRRQQNRRGAGVAQTARRRNSPGTDESHRLAAALGTWLLVRDRPEEDGVGGDVEARARTGSEAIRSRLEPLVFCLKLRRRVRTRRRFSLGLKFLGSIHRPAGSVSPQYLVCRRGWLGGFNTRWRSLIILPVAEAMALIVRCSSCSSR